MMDQNELKVVIGEDYYLQHYGKKGMKWGVRQSRKEVAGVGKQARKIRKQFDKARTNQERKAAADRYEQEIMKTVRSKEFKEKYRAANTMTKGDMAMHVLMVGPMALATIPETKKQMADARLIGPSVEEAAARNVLKAMRN